MTSLCHILKVNRSGFYACKKNPLSERAKANAQILTEIKHVESGGIYESPRIHRDLREAGIACGENRVAKIMRDAQLKSARGYRKPRFKAGKPMIAAPNRLEQRFSVDQANTAWVTNITYIRTY